MSTTISNPIRETAAKSTPQERPAGHGAAHGRETERQIIRDLLQCAQRDGGGVALVEGEPGIGISQLLRDATDEAAKLGFSLAAGAADQLGQAIPFFPLCEILREPSAGLAPGHPDAVAWWITGLRVHLDRRSEVAPVLVCLDDLNWASPDALAVLRAVPHALRQRPVAWLLARSTVSHCAAECLFDLLEKDGAARIALAPLDQYAVTAMLTDALGAPPGEALADLACGAAGNPALLTELIGGLRDDHAVRIADGRAELSSAYLPQRVLRLAQHRLDRLGHQARHLLMTAAVLGPLFRLEDAAEMLGETPAILLPAVQEAMDASIVSSEEHTFAFRHELLRRAVAETIPQPARSALHRQYSEILLARGQSAAQAASHLLQAAYRGDPASLVGLDRAVAQTLESVPQTAADLAVRALELTSPGDSAALSRTVAAAEALTAAGQLGRADQITAQAMIKPLPLVAEARLRSALSSILSARGQARDAVGHAQLVLAQPELPGDLRDQALAAHLQALAGLRDGLAGLTAATVLATPGHPDHVMAAALITRAVIAWDEGQIGDALELLRDAARHDNEISYDARRVQPLLVLAAALVDLRQLEDADSILRAADSPRLPDMPARAAMSLVRARVHLYEGRLADAAADAHAALAIAQTSGADGYAATAHSVLSMIELRGGDVAAAARHIACRSGVGAQFADLYARPETTAAEVQVREACEGSAAVLSRLRELGAEARTRPGLLLGDPALAAWLVRTALAEGDSELAATVTHTARALANANPEFPALTAAAAHSQGLDRRDPDRLAQAAAQYSDPWATASAAEDLGVLHAAQGDRAHAIGHLKEALGGYCRASAERDQARVRRRLRNFGIRDRHWAAPAERPTTGWQSLTDTEEAVVILVAQGLNNSQVATRMYISRYTVAHHLRQIFPKLGIVSRHELVPIVLEHTANTAGQPDSIR
jgi:DNA-binding CsgD family transcriptional regulator